MIAIQTLSGVVSQILVALFSMSIASSLPRLAYRTKRNEFKREDPNPRSVCVLCESVERATTPSASPGAHTANPKVGGACQHQTSLVALHWKAGQALHPAHNLPMDPCNAAERATKTSAMSCEGWGLKKLLVYSSNESYHCVPFKSISRGESTEGSVV